MLSILFNLLLANLKIYLMLLFLISCLRLKLALALALAIGVPITVANDTIEMLPLVAGKTIKELSK